MPMHEAVESGGGVPCKKLFQDPDPPSQDIRIPKLQVQKFVYGARLLKHTCAIADAAEGGRGSGVERA